MQSNDSWDDFNALLASTPSNPGLVGSYLPLEETCPAGLKGIFCSTEKPLFDHTPGEIIRTVTEGQFLGKAAAICKAGFIAKPDSKLIVVGGGSVNNTLVSLCCDIFGIDAYQASESSSIAAVGGAYISYADVNGMDKLSRVISEKSDRLEFVCSPNKEKHEVYKTMSERYSELEKKQLSKM